MKRVVKIIKTEGKKSSHGLTVMQEYNNLHMFFNKFNVVKFMNHGFYPKSNLLKQEDLLFKYEATLYLELLKDIKTENLNLLDIGCGRGGGINVLKKYLKLKEANGCDINSMAIDYCEENYKDIDFKICSSEKLTYENEYFDLITNVESFHLYENKEKFFKEASRVLKTNGHLLMTDINLNYNLGDSFKDYFEVIDIIDITPNVAFACKHNIKHYNKNIKNEEMKNHLINVRKQKLDSYLKDNTYYIVKLIKKKI
jgi:ubiquinone/menaquinone biosynthesis C-methylase UbiE|tara:strand:- start:13 stop:777 length:765 start_codon:yes stop_codon:yes gene_type:complete